MELRRTPDGYFLLTELGNEISIPSPESLRELAVELLRSGGLGLSSPDHEKTAKILEGCELTYECIQGVDEFDERLGLVIMAPDGHFSGIGEPDGPKAQAIMFALQEVCPVISSDRIVYRNA